MATILIAGCAEEPTCDFDNFVNQRLEPAGLEDCGSLEAYFGGPRDETAWVAAQTCVQSHLDQRVPFVVRFQSPIIDYGTYLTIYSGREIDGVWMVGMLTESTTAKFETYATQWSCTDLRAPYANCGAENSLYESLCFKCVDAANTERCRGD